MSFQSAQRLPEGALADEDETAPPTAWAMASFNEGTPMFGQDDRCADLLLLVRPRSEDGRTPPPAQLEHWRDALVASLALPASFSCFLAGSGMRTYDSPPAKFGFALAAGGSLEELVDTSRFRPLNGSTSSRSITSYAVAERRGHDAEEVALDVLRFWLEYGLKVEGYEAELDRLIRHA